MKRRDVRWAGRRGTRARAAALLLCLPLVFLSACAELPASRTGNEAGDGQESLLSETEAPFPEDEDGRDTEQIDVDWWEREDEFPHNSKDPFKRKLDESIQNLDEICELFTDTSGGFFAVGRESGTVYVYS
ncbi:MAG: hypothetical protein LBH86_08250, partial [Oscillospiraceae bacterium]|nr:hypothetical protein [Oscillospiraceae bacterium]